MGSFDDLIPQRGRTGGAPQGRFDDLIPQQQQRQPAPRPDDVPAPRAVPAVASGPDPEQGSFLGDMKRLAGAFGEGANEGVVRFAEMPYDLVNNAPRLANLLPGEQNVGAMSDMAEDVPVLGQLFASRDPLQEGAEQVGITGQIEPRTPAERISKRIGQEVGLSILPQAGLTARAAQLPKGIGAMNQANLFDRAITLPFRRSPGANNAAETAVAAGAGAGAGAARESLGDTNGNDMLGALAGGIGTSAALSLASNIPRAASYALTDRAAREATGEALVKAAADPDAAYSPGTITKARQIDELVPGVKSSTGQASGDPGVLAMEYSRSTGGPGIARYQQRQAQNNAALRGSFEGVAPDVADDTATRAALEARKQRVTDTAGRVVDQRRTRAADAAAKQADVEQQAAAARQGFEDEYADVASQRPLREQGSEELAAAYRGARESTAATRRAAYDEAQARGQGMVSAEPFQREVDGILDDIGPLADTAQDPTLARLVRDIESLAPEAAPSSGLLDASGNPMPAGAPGAGELRIADIIDMQPRIARAMRSAQGSMRGDTVKALYRLERTMRRTLDDAAEGRITPDGAPDPGAQAWREANRLSAEEAPLFRDGVGGQMDKQTRRRNAPADTAVGSKFIREDGPGAREGVQQLRQIIDRAPDPDAARRGVRDYVVGSMADRLAGRKPSVKAVDDFLRQHGEVLDEFPEVRKEMAQMRNRLDAGAKRVGNLEEDISAATDTTKAAEGSLGRAQARADRVGKSLDSDKTVIGRYLNRETGSESMQRILSANKPKEEAAKLMRQLEGDPDAMAGARRAFFDLMDDTVSSTSRDLNDNPLFKRDTFVKFLNKNEDVAREVLGEAHARDLRKITRDLDVLGRTTNAKPRGSSGTAAGNQGAGLTLNSVLSRLYGIQRGVVSPRFVVGEVGTRLVASAARKMRQGDIDRLLDEALLDPQLARTLTMEFSKENERLLTRRFPAILARLGARAGRSRAAGVEDEEADEESLPAEDDGAAGTPEAAGAE